MGCPGWAPAPANFASCTAAEAPTSKPPIAANTCRHASDGTLDAKVQVRPAEKSSDKAPDFRIFAGRAEIGAAWKKTSNEGRDYLSVKLDDPSLPAPILANLFEMDGGEFELIWSRPNGNRSRE